MESSTSLSMLEYSGAALEHAVYPYFPDVSVDGHRIPMYPILKLAGEAGEFVEKIGKIIRNRTDSEGTNIDRVDLLLELGDVLWYINACAFELGYSLDEVATANLHKLRMRKENGTLRGSGDHR